MRMIPVVLSVDSTSSVDSVFSVDLNCSVDSLCLLFSIVMTKLLFIIIRKQ